MNKECVACNSPCDTCAGTQDNCTSCLSATSTPFLLINSCVAGCPGMYFNITTAGVCISCKDYPNLHCDFCLYSGGQIVCSSTCNTGYIYFSSNQSCISSLPSGYVNISGTAYQCDAQCKECTVNQITCTSCPAGLNLYATSCITPCPSTTVAINNICEPCTFPCATCSSTKTNCDSCSTAGPDVYYLNGDLCQTSCPSTTFKNDSALSCQNCQSNCDTC